MRRRLLLERHDKATGDAVLKQDGARRVTRVRLDAEGWAVVKQEPLRGLGGWLRAVARRTRAQRSAAGHQALIAAGFEAPGLLDAIREPGRLLTVWEHVPGPTLHVAWSTPDRGRQRGLARAAATFAARLHTAGLSARDLKPANLIVTVLDVPVLVDLDDVVSTPSDLDLRVRNLASLDAYGQRAEPPLGVAARWRALEAYCAATGADPRELVRAVLPASRAKRRRG
ncbi:MAG: hypothetical protein KDD82_07525 [Planctomycetes bacterium]|nr:hypothetical protein [Planctomycetota bacterium]